ncbi:MAG: hypothetical protein JW751_17815 [Polyangiaceae bacterium]|nr:hypothetical protein [Polyangiaceae bacterium]
MVPARVPDGAVTIVGAAVRDPETILVAGNGCCGAGGHASAVPDQDRYGTPVQIHRAG